MSPAPGALRSQTRKQEECEKIYLLNARIAGWISCRLNVNASEDKPNFFQKNISNNKTLR
ncbi:hypothetical protein ENKO_25900 [Enterobacter kobei]|jgi:hypothetical protein|uniref:Uncharacterized protein n=1 Tax=Enterobacter kobei TaxID=208224 RepID=A0AA86M562_9ENTR|nr:hypothetical protein ENKO_25900 [Enterobacter kobei]SIQ32957.1 hypothetical protein SAMN05444841_10144 [Enterobacter kobei]